MIDISKHIDMVKNCKHIPDDIKYSGYTIEIKIDVDENDNVLSYSDNINIRWNDGITGVSGMIGECGHASPAGIQIK